MNLISHSLPSSHSYSSSVTFGAFTINFQLVAMKAFPELDFPKRHKELVRNIEVLQILMQILTFSQFGALIYTILRTQWHKRHETAKKLKNLKKRATSMGGRRSRSSQDGNQSGGEEKVTVDVVAAAGEDGGDDADDGDDGAMWAGDSSGIELQPVPRHNGSTVFEDDDEIQWKPNPWQPPSPLPPSPATETAEEAVVTVEMEEQEPPSGGSGGGEDVPADEGEGTGEAKVGDIDVPSSPSSPDAVEETRLGRLERLKRLSLEL